MRDYDPSLARYIQADPIGLGGSSIASMNVYGYVGQNSLKWIDPSGLVVKICSRPAQIVGGLVDHYWIKTDTKEAGMGANPNITPGQQYEGYGMPVQITDHSKDTPTQCTEMKNVDEPCINNELEIGKPLGSFIPPFNQCKSFAYGVVNKCRIGPQITPNQ